MKFRPHRGSLSEAMNECIEVNSLDDVWDYLHAEKYGIKKDMNIDYYCYDNRIKWDTYIITNKHWGVLGFSNGNLPQHNKMS